MPVTGVDETMTTPQITALPPAPTPQDSPEAFNDKAFRVLAAQEAFVEEANELAEFVAQKAGDVSEDAHAASVSASTAADAQLAAENAASTAVAAKNTVQGAIDTLSGIDDELAATQEATQEAKDIALAAISTAEEAGVTKYADTYADLLQKIGLGQVVNGDYVKVFADEENSGYSSIYAIEAGAPIFKRNVDQLRADLTTFSGAISATPEWSAVPAHEDSDLDAQTQAALNRIEKLKDDQQHLKSRTDKAVLSFPDYAAASAAAATLPDGQALIAINESDLHYPNLFRTASENLVVIGRKGAPSTNDFGIALNTGDHAGNLGLLNGLRTLIGTETPITIPAGDYGLETTTTLTKASGTTVAHYTMGTTANPTKNLSPFFRFEKIISPNEGDASDTSIFIRTVVNSGTKGTNPLAVVADGEGSNAGGAIAIQMRAVTRNAESSGWGGWSYVDVQGVVPVRAIGHEVNVRYNGSTPLTWQASGGEIDALVVANVDNGTNNSAHSAIKITKSSNAQGFLTGIKFAYDIILPSDTSDLSVLNGEAILINGANTDAKRYGGIRFGANNGVGYTRFHYALRTSEASFNNSVAIWLGVNHRIRWGSALNSGQYLTCDGSNLNIVGGGLEISAGVSSRVILDGVKVLDRQQSAIANATTGTEVSTINSILAAMRSHGLIATA